MSRSHRHTTIQQIAGCRSEKWWKQKWHRAFRRRSTVAVFKDREPPLYPEEVGADPWTAPKDGKYWFGQRLIAQNPRWTWLGWSDPDADAARAKQWMRK